MPAGEGHPAFARRPGPAIGLSGPVRSAQLSVYASVTGWRSFEPWLTQVEQMDPNQLWQFAEAVPPEWYGGNLADLERLMEILLQRRGRVRELIDEFRNSNREPFPNWDRRVSVVVPTQFDIASLPSKFIM